MRGCFQNVEKNEEDNLFASTPSLVTMRLLLCMAMSRNWGITLGDVGTAFLHAPMSGEVYVWPSKEFYPNGDCLWKLKKAMYGLRQAPKLWQEHFADVMISKSGDVRVTRISTVTNLGNCMCLHMSMISWS